MIRLDRLGNLTYEQVSKGGSVGAPQTHPRDFKSAQRWAWWALNELGLRAEIRPDPIDACRRAKIRAVERPRALMTDDVQIELWKGQPVVVIAAEISHDPLRYHFHVAYQLGCILRRRHQIQCRNPDFWALAFAAAFLVPAAALRRAWKRANGDVKAVLAIWRNVPNTAITLRVGELQIANIWVYESMELRHARVREAVIAGRVKPRRRSLHATSLSDGFDRFAVVEVAA